MPYTSKPVMAAVHFLVVAAGLAACQGSESSDYTQANGEDHDGYYAAPHPPYEGDAEQSEQDEDIWAGADVGSQRYRPGDYNPIYGPAAVQRARSPETVMKLHMMTDKGLSGMGAVCLDGSDAGFYFSAAANSKDWLIHFQGGGWCYDEKDCLVRSKGFLGSSKHWPSEMTEGGIMSDDCTANPDFCNVNRVHLIYCDGNSFSGNREKPLIRNGSKLYFRGKRIMDAALETLLDMGLDKAENVLLNGCSAGGLATFLHADYVSQLLYSKVPSLKKFRAAPISGMFLLHDTVEGRPVYPTEMKYIFNLANSSGGVNAGCIEHFAEEDRWKCNFAQYSYAFTTVPIFLLQSALDSWQTSCIYTSRLPPKFPNQQGTGNGDCDAISSWHECAGSTEQCSDEETKANNAYITDFMKAAESAKTYSKAGNGAFIHSCHTHCAALNDELWNVFQINGVTMRQALSSWWHSSGEPAASHTYSPCLYNESSTPRQCNPSCSASGKDLFV